MHELENRLPKIRRGSADHELQALTLQRTGSFAWATCGAASHVNTAYTNGASPLLITDDEGSRFTDDNEAPGLEQKEELMDQGRSVRERRSARRAEGERGTLIRITGDGHGPKRYPEGD